MFITGIAIAAVLGAMLAWHYRQVKLLDRSGDPDAGIIVYVESVRWLFVFWGFRAVVRGFRKAGRREAVHLFRWSTPLGSLLVFPDLVRQKLLLERSEILANELQLLFKQHPQVPIHLISYSSGCYVATEACKRLPDKYKIGLILLLSPPVSPGYDLTPLSATVERIVLVCSKVDVICAVGTLLFGTNDRLWKVPAGVVGLSNPPDFVVQYHWSIRDVRYGFLGDHFTFTSPWFIENRIAKGTFNFPATDS